jgi:predicted sugar kinase
VFETVVPGVHEASPIAQTLRALTETVRNDEVASVCLEKSKVLIVAEGAEGGGFFESDPSLGLKDNLFAKTVIEYPILEVVPRENVGDWKIVTLLDVRKMEIPTKEVAQEVEAGELPTYQEIKQALKMDIIKGVMERAAEEELQLPG